MHSAGQPRARMHHACGSWMSVGSDHACGFWMSVGSDHACSNHARACIMHAGYLAVARAHASCMQILHANSRCRICMAVIEFHAHIMQGAHIFPVNWLCTPFVGNSEHRSLKNRILVTGKKCQSAGPRIPTQHQCRMLLQPARRQRTCTLREWDGTQS